MTSMNTKRRRLPAWLLSSLAFLALSTLGGAPLKAQEAGLIQRQAALEKLLLRLDKAQRWEPVAGNIREFDAWIKADSNRRRNYEFGIMRNGRFRILHISEWNGGMRYMTEPYMTGDRDTSGTHGFRLGGSVWLVGTQEPEEETGPSCAKSQGPTAPPRPDLHQAALHRYYYYYGADGVKTSGGNGCTVEGPVYARARLFGPAAP